MIKVKREYLFDKYEKNINLYFLSPNFIYKILENPAQTSAKTIAKM